MNTVISQWKSPLWTSWSFKTNDPCRRSNNRGIFEVKNTEPFSTAKILFVFSPVGALHAFARVQMRSMMNSSLLCSSSCDLRKNLRPGILWFKAFTTSFGSFFFNAFRSNEKNFPGNIPRG